MTATQIGSTRAAPGSGMTRRVELIAELSPREREVLALMAEGWSNRAIGERLDVELKTVETHVSRVFTKLRLDADRAGNRRVRAVLTLLGRDRP